MAEDNTIFVLQKALMAHKAKVTKDSAAEFLLSHPRFPSLKSVCDGLKGWNIDHYPLKLSKQEILDLEPPFIAHIDIAVGQLALVEKTDYLPEIGDITKSNRKDFEILKIPGTPTFYLNGYRFLREYNVSDIEYFTKEIKSLTMESKGQEACSHCR